MSPRWCCAKNCFNNRRASSCTFFKLPLDKERALIWLTRSSRTDLSHLTSKHLHSNYVLCANHFESNCFKNKSLLKLDAVPTIFSDHSTGDALKAALISSNGTEKLVPVPNTSTDLICLENNSIGTVSDANASENLPNVEINYSFTEENTNSVSSPITPKRKLDNSFSLRVAKILHYDKESSGKNLDSILAKPANDINEKSIIPSGLPIYETKIKQEREEVILPNNNQVVPVVEIISPVERKRNCFDSNENLFIEEYYKTKLKALNKKHNAKLDAIKAEYELKIKFLREEHEYKLALLKLKMEYKISKCLK